MKTWDIIQHTPNHSLCCSQQSQQLALPVYTGNLSHSPCFPRLPGSKGRKQTKFRLGMLAISALGLRQEAQILWQFGIHTARLSQKSQKLRARDVTQWESAHLTRCLSWGCSYDDEASWPKATCGGWELGALLLCKHGTAWLTNTVTSCRESN